MGKDCKRIVIAITVALLLAGPMAPAQAPAPVQTALAAADVLNRIPAGCLGFVVVKNVGDLTTKIDNFIKQISPEGQPLLPMSLLEMIKGQAELGEGFDANGSFALVMLDPQQYGLDLAGVLSGTAAEPVKPDQVPAVFLIPGTDPEKLLAAHQPVKDGPDYKLSGMGDPPGWARQVGKHVLVSPCRKAIAGIAAAKTSVTSDLSPADKALLARNDVMVWANFKIAGPILNAAMARIEKRAAEMKKQTVEQVPVVPEPAAMPSAMMLSIADVLPTYRAIVKQLEDLALAARMTETGTFLEARISFLPDTTMGKALAAYKHVPGPLLHRLPNMPYVLAFGSKSAGKAPKEEQAKQIDVMLASEMFKRLTDESKAKLRNACLRTSDEVESVQFYAGSNTAGDGRLGVAWVFECKSAEKLRDTLADVCTVIAEVIKSSPDPNLKQLDIKYQKGLDALGATKLDVISIEHPELETIPEDGAAAMKVVLGEQKIRVYVAQTGKMLVLTLGGGKKFLASALQTAAGTGRLERDPAVAKVLAMMPKDRVAVGVFSLHNLMDLVMGIIKDVAAATGQEPPPINIQVASTTPFAGAITVEKADVAIIGYVPTAPIGDVVRSFMQMMMPTMPPPDDF